MECERSTYPGGKSGAGVYQRLINLIPPHRVLIVPFAGHCGVTRNIRPAEHTIVIDRDASVCEWWDQWRRSKRGRALEIHHCDGIEWLRYHAGVTEYSAAAARDAGSGVGRSSDIGSRIQRPVMDEDCDRKSPKRATPAEDAERRVARVSPLRAAEAFVFCDPPYILSERSTGRIYQCEMTDDDHQRFLSTATQIEASRYQILICGYRSELYQPLSDWNSIDHRVPTRGGLQDERIWMNYAKPVELHDYRFLGDSRRHRERIRRRQKNWLSAMAKMDRTERQAMLLALAESQ